jgi:hypothetical protein
VNDDPHIFVLKETQPRPGGALFDRRPDPIPKITNQARRGARKRPAPPRGIPARQDGACHTCRET